MVFIIAAMGSRNFWNFYERPPWQVLAFVSQGERIGRIIKDPCESEYTLNYIYHANRYVLLRNT